MSFVSKGAILTGVKQPFVVQNIVWDDPLDNEVVVNIKYCGCCHSDWHVHEGDYELTFPILTGHEGVGVVERVGKDVTQVKEGDHIVMSWMPTCGHCEWCIKGMGHLCDRGGNILEGPRPDGTFRAHLEDGTPVRQYGFLGAFCNKIVMPQDGCIPVDKSVNMRDIPIIGCRIPTGFGAVINVAKAKQGCTGMVVGLGGVGFNTIQGLVASSATKIIAVDIVDNKEEWARQFGATHYINSKRQNVVEEVMKITYGRGVDYAFDCIGSAEVQKICLQANAKDGTTVVSGVVPMNKPKTVEVDPFVLTHWQKKYMGNLYGGKGPFEQVPHLIEMYKAGRIKFAELVTKEYELEQINEAYADMLAGKNICGLIRLSE